MSICGFWYSNHFPKGQPYTEGQINAEMQGKISQSLKEGGKCWGRYYFLQGQRHLSSLILGLQGNQLLKFNLPMYKFYKKYVPIIIITYTQSFTGISHICKNEETGTSTMPVYQH